MKKYRIWIHTKSIDGKNQAMAELNASNSLEAITKGDRKNSYFQHRKVVKISSNISKMVIHTI